MRKMLLSLAVIGGLGAGVAGTAAAAPVALPLSVAGPAQVENVQYWRHGGWHRHHYWAWRRHHHFWRHYGWHHPGYRYGWVR